LLGDVIVTDQSLNDDGTSMSAVTALPGSVLNITLPDGVPFNSVTVDDGGHF
jgi:hypothetical protein